VSTKAPAHSALVIRPLSPFRKISAALIVLALAVRVVVPSGWMPSSERGFALTICTGMDVQTIWMDSKGKLHKEDPSKGKSVEHSPCAFAGDNIANASNHFGDYAALPHIASALPVFAGQSVSVGAGLVAPPPPATGPPSYI
jgi:hypothetical protein